MILIDKEKLIEQIRYNFNPNEEYTMESLINAINDYSQGIEVVRCKDCVHYDPPHINDNGKRIEYSDLSTDLSQEDFCVAEHIVSAKYGVNVGGRCTVDYHNGYSEDKRVYRKETDFCSKGER